MSVGLHIDHTGLQLTDSCLLLLCFFTQARMALEKGAQAVIFDVSDDAKAAAEVSILPKTRLHYLHVVFKLMQM